MTAPPVRNHKAERNWVGKSIPRLEDRRFLLGRGGYIDDMVVPNMLEVALVRSIYAHARIVSIDTAAAEAVDGVMAVVTGAQAAELTEPLPDFGPDPANHPWRCLALDKIRYAGEGVVAIAAESRAIAEDAAELVVIEYEQLDPIVDPMAAIEDGSPLVHDTLGTNVAFNREFTFGDVDGDFATADRVISDTLYWGRSGGQPIETVGAIAEYNNASGMMTIHANSLSFTSYLFMLAGTLRVPSNKLDMHPVSAGGSFGSKLWEVKTPAIAGMLSKVTGRPVKYLQDRMENISNGDHHGSDRYYEIQLALMDDGTMRSMKIKTVEDYGAYIQFGVGHHGNALAQVTGPYKISSVFYDVTAVLTNKCQQGAYRGFGSEVGNWAIERMVDLAAKELGMDPAQLRRQNFIGPEEFPYFIPTGNVYDSGNYEGVLDTALELADYAGWRQRQEEARAEGRHIGIGICTCQERSVFSATEFWFWFDEPAAPVSSMPESVTLDVDALGNMTATLYSCAMWGNSPETMVAQLVGEEFDVDPQTVNVVYAGSNQGLPATGPGGSRFTVMVAGAIEVASGKIKKKAAKIAAHLLEANVEDLNWANGGFEVAGTPTARMELADIAIQAHLFKHGLPDEIESGLEASHVYDHPYTTMPNDDRTDLGVFYPFMGHASHIAVVEVDVETGKVDFLDYTAVHDCGTMVNPRSLCGHIVGGTAQGIGTAIFEEFIYDSDGVLQTPSFAEYVIPTSMDVPPLKIGHQETPSPYTPHGIKGGGEAGRMMAPAAISSAIEDALRDYDVRVRRLPATPERIVNWIDGAG